MRPGKNIFLLVFLDHGTCLTLNRLLSTFTNNNVTVLQLPYNNQNSTRALGVQDQIAAFIYKKFCQESIIVLGLKFLL